MTTSLLECGALARRGAGFQLSLRGFSPGDLRRQQPVGWLRGPHQDLTTLAEAVQTLSAVPEPGTALG
ncbi:MAG: hypothetical protein M3N52_07775, partial [Actinomycetota bacterium]|nr:hypothetical protein [Actinomycetota bacterium]